MAHGGRARGEMGGGPREQCGSNKRCTGSPFGLPKKNLTTGLIWLVPRVGGWGEAWGGGPWRAGKGGDGGGAPESSVGATKDALVPPFGSDLAGAEGGGMGGGVGRWPMEGGQGGRWGGGPREQCGSNKRCTGSTFNNWSDLAGKGGGMGGGVGRWPMEGRARGEMGGGPREQCGSNKRCTGSPFWAGLKNNNWSDLAGAGEAWGGEGGQGGRWGWGRQRAVWEQQKSFKNLTTGLIWGEAWGGGPWRSGKGGDGGGGTREQCGSNKRCTGSPFWAPLKT